MFETIREFALARLADRSDADAVHGEHASYYLALARDAAPGLYGADQPARLEQLSTEYENLRSALAWCSAIPERAPAGLAIASDLGLYWFVRGLYQEGLRWLDPLLDATEAERTPERAGALWAAGLLATLSGDEAAAPVRLGECAELAQQLVVHGRSWCARSKRSQPSTGTPGISRKPLAYWTKPTNSAAQSAFRARITRQC